MQDETPKKDEQNESHEHAEEEKLSQRVEEEVQAAPEEPKKEKPELPKRLVSQTKRIGGAFPAGWGRLKTFWLECKRVLRVTKKPDKQEFATIVKVSAIGMAVIGVIGFLIHMVKELLF